MEKLKFIVFILCFLIVTIKAQTPRSVNLELLGVHNLIGFSFDSRFSNISRFGYKIGVGYGFEKSQNYSGWMYEFGGKNADFRTSPIGFLRNQLLKNAVSIPLSIYYLTGEKNSHFEIGFGFTPYYADFKDYEYNNYDGTQIITDFDGFNYYGFIQLGYRYECSKLIYSAGFDIPFKTLGSKFEQTIGLYPKVSIGYRF